MADEGGVSKRTGASAEPKSKTAAKTAAKPRKPAAKSTAPSTDAPKTTAERVAEKAAPRLDAESVSKAAEAAYAHHLLDPTHRDTLEALSMNLAKAAMTVQGAMATAALRQADKGPMLDADPLNVAPAMTQVAASLASDPHKLMRAQADLFGRYMDLWSAAARQAMGTETLPPAPKDKRFADPAWSENPVFDVMRRSYLLTSEWLNGLVAGAEGVDPLVKRRAEFFTKLLTDAFSPANFLASNPVALKALMESKGESLVKGMEQFAADVERGGGKLAISQTDYQRFKVGENVATAPGRVVWRGPYYELIQYAPTTETVRETPLLIFPPWINKFYILDLRPENSMIRWLTGQGFTVFLVSWINPDAGYADRTFQDYMEGGVYDASAKVMEQTGAKRINAVGYCIGGTMLGASLARMAKAGDDRFNAVTFFAAQHDFAEAGDLLLFTDEEWLSEVEKRMDEAGGVLPGSAMADTFNALRANDLIWSFFVNNYLMGKEPAAFDLLYWNSDQTRMPKALHLFYLRQFYGRNAFARGELEVAGERLDPTAVTIPMYFQASREDHIAPMNSVYRSARLFGGPVTYTLAGSGHIAGVINHPDAKKYQHWTNADLPDTLDAWRSGAEERPGSWWPHWAEWLHDKSGGFVPARDPSAGPLKPLEPAPGSYVKVRS